MNADWTYASDSLVRLSRYFNGYVSLSVGWNETSTDTILVTEDNGIFRAYVWNRPNIRAEFTYLLSLPITRLPEFKQ